MSADARTVLLHKVVAFAADGGIAGRSLREIAAGVGTSHRMLLYHFATRDGLMAAVVGLIEEQQRAAMIGLAHPAGTVREVMTGLWQQVSSPELRPFVRLFFEVFGQAVQGAPGTEALLRNLTTPWLDEGAASATALGVSTSDAELRLGVAVTRGLLMELLAGADECAVHASYERFIRLYEQATNPAPGH